MLRHSKDPSGNWSIVLGLISLVTRVLAPSPFLLFLNVGSSPVFTAGEPLCGASAVPALRSEPALSCCSADSTAPSQSPAPGRNLREGRRETVLLRAPLCLNETHKLQLVFFQWSCGQHGAKGWFFIHSWSYKPRLASVFTSRLVKIVTGTFLCKGFKSFNNYFHTAHVYTGDHTGSNSSQIGLALVGW